MHISRANSTHKPPPNPPLPHMANPLSALCPYIYTRSVGRFTCNINIDSNNDQIVCLCVYVGNSGDVQPTTRVPAPSFISITQERRIGTATQPPRRLSTIIRIHSHTTPQKGMKDGYIWATERKAKFYLVFSAGPTLSLGSRLMRVELCMCVCVACKYVNHTCVCLEVCLNRSTWSHIQTHFKGRKLSTPEKVTYVYNEAIIWQTIRIVLQNYFPKCIWNHF